MTSFNGPVKRAFSSQSTLVREGEHCCLDPERLASIGRVLRSQIRVRRSAELVALYTVSETRPESTDTTVRMGRAGRLRLGTEDEFEATIESQVPHPTFSDQEARDHSEFVERLNDDGCQQGLVVLAPHGGFIEAQTDRQAERVASLLGQDNASVWQCKGFSKDERAYDSWHITSIDVSPVSFPLLNTIISRRFTHAVAFHGFDEADVLIGGRAPLELKQEIECAVKKALAGSEILVRIAGPSDNFGGDNPDNIVNRITAGGRGGVQIEQCLEARTEFWREIAEAVALVYDTKLSLLERPAETVLRRRQ